MGYLVMEVICQCLLSVFRKSPFFVGLDFVPGEYMLNVKNKRMNSLKEEIECSKGHLLYLIDVHIFSKVNVIRVFFWKHCC